MNKQFVAASILALSAMTGVTQADLVTDMTRMPVGDALAIAVQTQGASIESLITDAAAHLANSPKLLSALVSEAVRAYPDQAAQIVYAAVLGAPNQKEIIVSAAIAQLPNNPTAQPPVRQAANSAEQIALNGEGENRIETDAELTETDAELTETDAELTETEGENTEIVAATPPPAPPPGYGGSTDHTTPVSPN